MKELFFQVLDMSVSATWLALAVMLLRLVLKKAPKYLHCILWGMVALRLICPTLPESQTSLIPDSQPVSSVVLEQSQSPSVITPVQPPANLPETSIPQEPEAIPWEEILGIVWVVGVAVMAAYGMVSYLLLRRKVAPSVEQDGAWLCDDVASPFILGILRPRIYLPSGLSHDCRESVLAHERAHLRRKDHWWKPLGFVLLAIHWFNPVMWLAYILLCRDIEAACDERVIKGMDAHARKQYSEALLSCAAPRRYIAACPLAFGEQGIKGRIKSVLSYKKPTIWIILAAVVASTVLVVCFLTNPIKNREEPIEQAGVVYFDIYDQILVTTGRLPGDASFTRYIAPISQEELTALTSGLDEKEWLDLSKYDTAIAFEYKVTVVSDSGADSRVYYFGTMSSHILTEREMHLYFAESTQSERELFNNLKQRATKQDTVQTKPSQPDSSQVQTMALTIADTLPSCLAFESNCFYATGDDGNLYRVCWSDMDGLYEGQSIQVTYPSDSKKELKYPEPPSGWSPQYEITAFAVEAVEPAAVISLGLYDQPVCAETPMDESPTYYDAYATEDELEILMGLIGDRPQWLNPLAMNSAGVWYGTMTVIFEGVRNDLVLYRNGILTEKGYSPFTDEEQKTVSSIISRKTLPYWPN